MRHHLLPENERGRGQGRSWICLESGNFFCLCSWRPFLFKHQFGEGFLLNFLFTDFLLALYTSLLKMDSSWPRLWICDSDFCNPHRECSSLCSSSSILCLLNIFFDLVCTPPSHSWLSAGISASTFQLDDIRGLITSNKRSWFLGRWFQRFFHFRREPFGKIIQFDLHIFFRWVVQRNHQLVIISGAGHGGSDAKRQGCRNRDGECCRFDAEARVWINESLEREQMEEQGQCWRFLLNLFF